MQAATGPLQRTSSSAFLRQESHSKGRQNSHWMRSCVHHGYFRHLSRACCAREGRLHPRQPQRLQRRALTATPTSAWHSKTPCLDRATSTVSQRKPSARALQLQLKPLEHMVSHLCVPLQKHLARAATPR
jgi:hypothetical protein